MAKKVTIGGDGKLFVGEDKLLSLAVVDAAGAPVDMSGWTVVLTIKDNDNPSSPVLIQKTASITGAFNAALALNEQRAEAILPSGDSSQLREKLYRHSWWRTDAGGATVLAYGDVKIEDVP